MASSSISSIHKSFKYDLFVSFRGEDTRKNFVDHLYYALQRQGIHTFKDDKRVKKGKRIDTELIEAIEDSKLFLIVFSKNYASSSWCLDELVKILECQKTTKQTAYPVFYDVEPTEVRKQSESFGKAFAKHKVDESFEIWKHALKDAADLAGWELKKTANGHEAEFIKQIVEEISLKLRSINFGTNEKLVGMESRIKDVELLLESDSDDVHMIGIKGMGGGGKTTLARALFDKISFHFDSKSFVENVREASQASLTGLQSLQKQVLSDVLHDKDINVNNVHDGKNMMIKTFSSRKVFLVLDDVDHLKQLEFLAGEPSWFMAGSIIIITTRDEHVLVAHRVKRIRNVSLLSDDEATCLFSKYAFGRDAPVQEYTDLSLKVVSYVSGLPLTAKVLGSFLCGKNELEWIDALERLETIPEKETIQVLELSYIGLEDDYKEIFLNIVCVMVAWMKDDAIHVLESCGFHARTGLKVLEEKSLVTTLQDDFDRECIDVHDLIKEMGRNIVRRFNPDEPSTHCRLWIFEEIKDIFANDMGTKATKYINLQHDEFIPEIFMKGFGNMEKLLFLHVSIHEKGVCFSDDGTFLKDGHVSFEDGNSSNYMKIDKVRQYFPNSLRYLGWDGYHHWCLPKSFGANELVGLRMRDSRIGRLWENGERMVMKKLKFLDFSDSMLETLDLEMTPKLERLDLWKCIYLNKLITPFGCHLKLKFLYVSQSNLTTLDLRMAQNLETLDLRSCIELVELCLPVKCPKLTYLNLSYLSKLRELNLGLSPNLEEFYFVKCHSLLEFHMPVGFIKLKYLTLHLSTSTTTLDLGLSPNLEKLYLEECHNLVEFQALINGCPKLRSLKIINSNLKTLDLGIAQNLEELHLENCPDLVEFSMSISFLKLRSLDLNLSKLRILELGLNPSLENLRLAKCQDLLEFHMPVGCPALTNIEINNSKLRTLDLGMTLVTLSITQCYDLVKLQMPYGCPNLRNLYLRYSKLRTLDLRLTPNLDELLLFECDELEDLHMPINGFPNLTNLNLQHLKVRTLDLRLTPNLDRLHLEECDELVELHMPVNGCSKLTHLYIRHLKFRTLDLRLTTDLCSLDIQDCPKLIELHMPVGCTTLKYINISNSKLRTLDLGPAVVTLSITRCYDLVKFRMLKECPKLRDLYLQHSKLTTLDLQLAANLALLKVEECDELVELHMPVNKCSKLTYLYLRHVKLRTLDLQVTPNINELNLEGCDKLMEVHMPVNGCSKLTKLYLKELKLTTLDLRLSPDLYSLDIEHCHDLVQLHMPVRCSELRTLNLYHSMLRNLDLGMAPNLKILSIKECHDLVQHNAPTRCVQNLGCIDLSSCSRLKSFLLAKQSAHAFELSVTSIDVCPLETQHSLPAFRFSCLFEEQEQLSSTAINLQKLVSLASCCIRNFKSFSESICGLHSLSQLTLHGNIPEMPQHLEKLEYLEVLVLSSIRTKHLPESFCMLKHLRSLKLDSCWHLEKLPEDIGRLECLEELILKRCTSLTDIPVSICKMKRLKKFSLAFCTRVEKLPEELGRLKYLEELNVKGTGISRLPNNISLLKGLRVVGSESLDQSSGFSFQGKELTETFCCFQIKKN